MMFHILHRTVGLKIVISICLIKCNKIHTASVICERIKNDGCCDGYFWNQTTRDCTLCTAGYTGPNCTIRCPFPSYGERCQGYCECSNDTCDASTGCTTLTPDDKTSPMLTTATDFGENTTFRSMENHTSKFSSDGTYFTETIESTNFEGDTFNTSNNSTSKSLDTYKHTLILLIKGFGGADILLICTYSFILMIDRYNQKKTFQINNRRKHAPITHSMYENIEIVFSPND